MTVQRSQGAPRPSVAPADEQPFAEPAQAAPIVARDPRGRVTSTAAARAMAKLPRASRFVPRNIACDPRFAANNRSRTAWLRARRAELYAMTGGVSHGVGAMLNAAAWLYAGGEYAAERAAEAGDVELFKVAASLTATARTHDFGAYELAVREGKARPRNANATPWLVASDDDANGTTTNTDDAKESNHGSE